METFCGNLLRKSSHDFNNLPTIYQHTKVFNQKIFKYIYSFFLQLLIVQLIIRRFYRTYYYDYKYLVLRPNNLRHYLYNLIYVFIFIAVNYKIKQYKIFLYIYIYTYMWMQRGGKFPETFQKSRKVYDYKYYAVILIKYDILDSLL